MLKKLLFLPLLLICMSFKPKPQKHMARQGTVSFFSYTTAENIEAKNNQVLSILDIATHKIAISMLMNSFVFKKTLMRQHFNDSYIESDLYPKATFEGEILNFDPTLEGSQTRIIKGFLNIKNITKEVEIKTTIQFTNGAYTISGDFNITVEDFNINIPPIVAPNIAKIIATKFRFDYQNYEK